MRLIYDCFIKVDLLNEIVDDQVEKTEYIIQLF